MADKPRVQAPKQRSGGSSGDDGRDRRILAAVGGLLAALALGGILFFSLGQGAEAADVETVRADLEAAGCTFVGKKAASAEHTVTDPAVTSDKWNTDPPTTGPHHATAAIFNQYDDEVELARVVHNLEHGGIFVFYGEDVPASTVEELQSFYDDHKTGTIMAPLDRLGDEFAVGAWYAQEDPAMGYLATCKTFDGAALAGFFSELQFKGPEHFDPSRLRPGH
jgi:hypothetical protein